MTDILITGATGLLGAQVVSSLARDHAVTAIARQPPTDPCGARWINHDLRLSVLPDGLPSTIDTVLHFAQAREFRDFPGKALDTFAINVTSTALLLNWAVAAGARRFVFTSTGGVYQPGLDPFREDSAVGGLQVPAYYAASKLAAEELARAYGSQFVVNVFRPFFIYGREQVAGMLLPRLVESIRSGAPIPIDGEQGILLNPIHVSDATRAVEAALALDESCVLNMAGPEVLSLRQVVDLLADRLGRPANLKVGPGPPKSNFVGDITRMTALLGPPRTTLADAADELIG